MMIFGERLIIRHLIISVFVAFISLSAVSQSKSSILISGASKTGLTGSTGMDIVVLNIETRLLYDSTPMRWFVGSKHCSVTDLPAGKYIVHAILVDSDPYGGVLKKDSILVNYFDTIVVDTGVCLYLGDYLMTYAGDSRKSLNLNFVSNTASAGLLRIARRKGLVKEDEILIEEFRPATKTLQMR